MLGRAMTAALPLIVAASVVGAGGGPGLTVGPLAATDDYSAIDSHVREVMDSWGVPGLAYGIARDGETIHLAAFGNASPDGVTMTPNTPVVVGSVGKSITALAIRQLVEAGRLDLDAPVVRYLPWFALDATEAALRAVTIRSLLNHTSGLSTADGQDQRWYRSGMTPEDVVRALVAVRPDRPAGTYEYSNLNFVILGVVIESVSGQEYGAYLQDHVFGPLGMRHSFATIGAAAGSGLATGHRYVFGMPLPFDEAYPTGMVAAGYQISSAADMAAFVAALSNGGVSGGVNVIRPGTDGTGQTYGTDWTPLTLVGPGLASGQSGSTLTTNADILDMPATHLGVAVVMNANPTQLMNLPGGAADIALDIARLVDGNSLPPAPVGVRLVYGALDAVLLGLLALLAAHVVRAATWRARLRRSRRPWLVVGRTILADAILPATVLLGIPLAVGAMGSSPPGDVLAGWRFIFWTLPDVGAVIVVLSAVPLGLGALKLVLHVRGDPGAARA